MLGPMQWCDPEVFSEVLYGAIRPNPRIVLISCGASGRSDPPQGFALVRPELGSRTGQRAVEA